MSGSVENCSREQQEQRVSDDHPAEQEGEQFASAPSAGRTRKGSAVFEDEIPDVVLNEACLSIGPGSARKRYRVLSGQKDSIVSKTARGQVGP
nr:hypothetical protein CFP56_21994 [Quercus suber]